MSPRARWLLTGIYVVVLLLPLVWIAASSGHEIGAWLETGVCPAGPPDRRARPCSIFGLCFIVFLGGWSAFIMAPAHLLWWTLVTSVAWAVRSWLRRRWKASTLS